MRSTPPATSHSKDIQAGLPPGFQGEMIGPGPGRCHSGVLRQSATLEQSSAGLGAAAVATATVSAGWDAAATDKPAAANPSSPRNNLMPRKIRAQKCAKAHSC